MRRVELILTTLQPFIVKYYENINPNFIIKFCKMLVLVRIFLIVKSNISAVKSPWYQITFDIFWIAMIHVFKICKQQRIGCQVIGSLFACVLYYLKLPVLHTYFILTFYFFILYDSLWVLWDKRRNVHLFIHPSFHINICMHACMQV